MKREIIGLTRSTPLTADAIRSMHVRDFTRLRELVLGFYRIEVDECREAVLWIGHYLSWSYKDLMCMTILELVDWHDHVKQISF